MQTPLLYVKSLHVKWVFKLPYYFTLPLQRTGIFTSNIIKEDLVFPKFSSNIKIDPNVDGNYPPLPSAVKKRFVFISSVPIASVFRPHPHILASSPRPIPSTSPTTALLQIVRVPHLHCHPAPPAQKSPPPHRGIPILGEEILDPIP